MILSSWLFREAGMTTLLPGQGVTSVKSRQLLFEQGSTL